jgi:beta-lactam-binding protein with PASTA domain
VKSTYPVAGTSAPRGSTVTVRVYKATQATSPPPVIP